MIIVSQDKSKITQRLEFYIQENFSTDEELRYEIRSIGGGIFGGYKRFIRRTNGCRVI